jgi:hypothetical protein
MAGDADRRGGGLGQESKTLEFAVYYISILPIFYVK